MATLLLTKQDYSRLKDSALRAKIANQENCDQANALLRGVIGATLVESSDIPPDVVTMNSVVRVKYLNTGRTLDLRLVYPEQADLKQNRISILAPIGMALLGSRKGEVIQLKMPHTVVQIKVERIVYQPEAAGHFFL